MSTPDPYISGDYSRGVCASHAPQLLHYIDLPETADLVSRWTFVRALEEAVPRVAGLESPVADLTPGSHVFGDVHIGPNSSILPGCVLEGPVFIGAGSTIGPNAYIRAYSFIGDGCRVGHCAEVVASLIDSGAIVAHATYVGRSLLAPDTMLAGGVRLATRRLDDGTVHIRHEGRQVDTGLAKFGALIGRGARIGTNVSLMPGEVISAGERVLPQRRQHETGEDVPISND